ncbi:hypothetical protein Q1695_010556 [Nippostrongylus brasiliensis]|nr:hypothetical protein Q1695_010556 [Nippostrongylus brasiliensis]
MEITPSQNLLKFCANGDVLAVDGESRKENINPNMRDADGNTPLILAAQAGYTKIVEMLLARFPTIEVDQVNHLGQTALMKAAIQGRVACARVLLRAKADPSLRDYSRGFCALDWAEYVGRTECMHMIAHFMLKPIKTPRAPFTSMYTDLQIMTAAAAAPLLGEAIEGLVPKPRPRLGSAPIPRLEITEAPDMGQQEGIHLLRRQPRRPRSSMS